MFELLFKIPFRLMGYFLVGLNLCLISSLFILPLSLGQIVVISGLVYVLVPITIFCFLMFLMTKGFLQ